MVVDDLCGCSCCCERRGRVSTEEDKRRAHGVEVLLLARWSRVLGRLTQRGFALACGFLLLLVADHLSTWHLTTFLQQTTSMGGGGSPA